MNDFDTWLATGPLAAEQMTERELLLAKIAFTEGRRIQNEQHIGALLPLARAA